MLGDSTAAFIAARQLESGAWEDSLTTSRAPMQESKISTVVRCLRVLQVYGIPARQAEFEARIAKARAWLEAAKPRHTYELADQLMGMAWAGSSADRVKRVAAELLRAQRADGG